MNLKQTPRQKDLIYDVGLHEGQDTDFYLKKGFRVVAFEANPDNVAICAKKFASAIADGRLTIVEGAITERVFSKNGHQPKVPFFRNKDHSFWGSTNEEWAYRNEVMGTQNEVIEVNATDFGACVEKYGIPFYLKADIVGSEMICLRALQQFENKPEYLSIRSEKVIFSKLEEEVEMLEQLGYEDFKAVQQDVAGLTAPVVAASGKKVVHNFAEGASGPFGEDASGTWRTKRQVLKDYRRIFVLYWLFGDFSYLTQTERGRSIILQLERVSRRALPGWYDTHARHSRRDEG